MVVDHIGFYLLDDNPWLRLVGRGAAPLFFFLIGYAGKLHISWELCLYGVVLSITGYVVNDFTQINILLSFILLHAALKYFPPQNLGTFTRLGIFVVCGAMTPFLYNYIEYGLLSIVIGYSARFIAVKENKADLWMIFALIIYYIWESLVFQFTSTPNMLYLFGFLILILFWIMTHYRPKTLNCPATLLMPALILSRYSLEVYFFHLIGLQAYRFLHLG